MIEILTTAMDIFLKLAKILVLLYAAGKFLGKPHNSLEQRVNALDVEVREIKDSLKQGNDRFRQQESRFAEQEKTNEILTRCTFALLEFEVHYCETEHKPISKNLEKAKDDLHDYLAKK